MGCKIIVMGVSGTGKTTIGRLLSTSMNATYIEADEYHPTANIEKMASGIALQDEDRWPWLDALCDAINNVEGPVIASCSALKEAYRQYIKQKIGEYNLVFLHGTKDVIHKRMAAREGHYMNADMLQSQLDILQPPEKCIAIDIENDKNQIVEKITKLMNTKYEIGLLGLGVMGKSLARNMASKGIPVMAYNLPFPGEENVVNDFINQYGSETLQGAADLPNFILTLKQPRLILLMITAGKAVDDTIELLLPHLSPGDMIIDAGNTYFADTNRRYDYLKKHGMHFIGMGVSGGEEGALLGPSIMPAGDDDAKQRLLPLLQKICAFADGIPCVNWFGHGGGGHFVKMIHNGIEYADMQLISEAYAILKHGLKMSNIEIANHFETYKTTSQNSYLIDITIDVLRKKINGEEVIDTILDVAGHKGTGVWTSTTSLELGVAAPTIVAAMNQRILSAQKKLRVDQGAEIKYRETQIELSDFDNALLFSRLIALTEGLHILTSAGKKYGWNYSLKDILQTWRGGCIIRSDMLLTVMKSLEGNEALEHLFESPTFNNTLTALYPSSKKIMMALSMTDIAAPALTASIQYHKTLKTQYLPVNLIQAQRDYFGAHTVKLLEDTETSVHIDW
jgi:6-phosphogluconate dehydrogenase